MHQHIPEGTRQQRGLLSRLLQEWQGESSEIVVWIYDTFDNNFGIENDFAKYLKENC